jgi:hypothetical protein
MQMVNPKLCLNQIHQGMDIQLIKIISMINKNKYFCRICGLYHEDPPWGNDNISPSFDFCDCCGCEFGYEDIQLKSICSYRDKWIKEGAKWFEPKYKPSNWNLNEQLKQIPSLYL